MHLPIRRIARPAPRSYTLIELIIVMALLALAAALLVPNLVGRDTMTLQAAVRLLIADLNFAQSDALANQEFRRVVFYDDGTGYCIIKVPDENWTTENPFNGTEDYVIDPLHTMGRYVVNYTTAKRFEGVSIDPNGTQIDGTDLDDRPVITYDTLGGTVRPLGLVGTGGTVVLKFGDVRYQVNIASFTGKLTVVEL